jgi:hypothetical protein
MKITNQPEPTAAILTGDDPIDDSLLSRIVFVDAGGANPPNTGR